jgi:putative membrane protein
MRAFIRNLLNGLAFGITETIPGVSGGTVAIILGFYFETIEAINHFTEDIRKYLKFAIPLILGIVTGLLLFSSLIHYLLTHYSFPTMLFFIGLIMGIIPIIFSRVKEPGIRLKPGEIIMIIIPFLVLLVISSFKGSSVVDSEEVIKNIDIPFMLFILIAGILAAAALVIPGISGSFVLLLLGIYPVVIYSVSSVRLLLTDISNTTLLINICKVLIPLGIGIVIGGLSMVRLIEKLLKRYHKIVYSIILGLLMGSVCVLFREPMVYKSGISVIIIIIGIATLSLGFVFSFFIGRKRLYPDYLDFDIGYVWVNFFCINRKEIKYFH